MNKFFRISLIVLLVFAFAFAVLQVLPGCQATGSSACINVGWNSRAEISSPDSYVGGTLPGRTPYVGWNS